MVKEKTEKKRVLGNNEYETKDKLCRLCKRPLVVLKEPGGIDVIKPCGCEYTEIMQLRDVVERIRTDLDLMATLADGIIGHDINKHPWIIVK